MYISKGQKKDKHLRVPTRVNVARTCRDATIEKIKDSLEKLYKKRSLLDDKRDDLKRQERVQNHKNRLKEIRETKRKYNEENESLKTLVKEKDAEILILKEKVQSLESLLNRDLQNNDNGKDIFINLPLLDEQEESTSIISSPRTEKKVKSIIEKKRNESTKIKYATWVGT